MNPASINIPYRNELIHNEFTTTDMAYLKYTFR